MHALLLALPLLVAEDEPFLVEGEVQTVFDAEVVSVANDNSRYQARVVTMFARLSSPPAKLGEFEFVHASMNPVQGITEWVTTVDAVQAQTVSELLGVEVIDRAPWPYQLEASLEVAPFRASDIAVPGRLTIRNPSPEEVTLPIAAMGIVIEGQERQLADKMQIGIEPGGATEIELDLRHRHDFPVAGIYGIELRIDSTLMLGPGGSWDQEVVAKSELEVQRPAEPRLIAEEKELAPSAVRIEARDNSNSEFILSLDIPLAPDTDPRAWPQLRLDERSYSFSSFGGSNDSYTVTTTVSVAEAQALAAAFGVAVMRRSHPGHRLTGRLEMAKGLEVRFHLANEGEQAIEYLDGGRSRNEKGRDNRFEVTVLRDGEEVTLPTLYDFGGLAGYRSLAPGEAQVIELDLLDWYDFEEPGEYRVSMRLALAVWPTGTMQGPYHSSRCWDDQVIASVQFKRP